MVRHKHLIVRAEVKRPFTIKDQEKSCHWLLELVRKVGMKVISGPHVAYATAEKNTGITACVLIETSHISLHVWDEVEIPLVQLDVYSCSDFDTKVIFQHMECMEPTKIEFKFLDREHGLTLLE